MHIDAVPNRGSRPAYLLRESYRVGTRVRKRTLANLSSLSEAQIEALRALLRGEPVGPLAERFEILGSRSHGQVQAVRVAMQRLGFAGLMAARGSRERDVVCAMVAARLLAPHRKLATTRWWHTTTLAAHFAVADADEDELYGAMDWLLERQGSIEKKLAARHLAPGGLVLYDLSSSYFEGQCCPLARIGHSRDGRKNTLQVNYGLVCAAAGCPVAISVYEGNTADAATLMPQIERLRKDFGVGSFVAVGDRGMIGQQSIEELRDLKTVSWITALKSAQIRTLIEQQALQLGLFDERNLLEFIHPAYPGERLIACHNPQLAQLRAHKRAELIKATGAELDKVQRMVQRGTLRGAGPIGVRAGRVVNQYRVAKHFKLDIEAARFQYRILDEEVEREAALDGIYVLRTGLSATQMHSADVVRSYKSLAEVERAFRSLKTVDLHVRPIHHHLADRVRSHIFLCMLAYYVEWHMREAWRPLLFAEEDLQAKTQRDPVAPAKRSTAAERKAFSRTLSDGSPVHSFRTLLEELASIVRNTCRLPARQDSATFDLTTTANPKQQRALELLAQITV